MDLMRRNTKYIINAVFLVVVIYLKFKEVDFLKSSQHLNESASEKTNF